ncbi:unnamed protein product [Adineta steineri]|uniref:Uncharacterized protein n=2 Tax=Adineta steineri TaxID=433720 RepID=A0A818ZMN4_9BILA|nr:unnamed protein product [Adineta steineri]
MRTLIFLLIAGISSLTHAQSPSDEARHKLVGLIADVRGADGRRYGSRDHLGNTMDCVKIIKRTDSEQFIGVYHTYINEVPRVNLAISDDLINWTWLRELAYFGSQPTIAVPSDQPQGYIVVWEQEPKNHLRFAFYPTWSDLEAGISRKNYSVPRTISPFAEGTPSIYGQPTVNNIDLGFHYYDKRIVDKQARGTLKNFGLWTQFRKQPNFDNALLHYGVQGNIGDRDTITNFDNYEFTAIEGQYGRKDFGTWRTFIFDPQTGNADQVDVITDGGSQAFANPTMTLTTWKGQQILIVTLFVPSELSAPGEAGELIYYHKL